MTVRKDSVRERRWDRVRRMANWHAAITRRHPVFVRLLNTAVRHAACGYAHLELPRSTGLLEAAIAAFPSAWQRQGEARCRGLWHGYQLRLEMSDYFQRWAYYLRRYHEVPLQVLLRASLRPGDVFVDVGANNGLVSMLAAWRVGPGGRVLAIEPNPVVARQLQWHVEANRLSQVTVLHIGLADVPGEGVLSVPGFDNLGAGTLAPLPSRYGGQTCQTSIVSLRTGDSVCASLPESPLVLKLDIEGLEVRALRGLEATISTRLPMIVCEVNEEMLEMAGSSACELWDYLTERGYLPFEFTVRRAAFRLRHLRLTPITRDQHDLPLDFAWLHPKGPHWTRLERLMGA